MTSEIALQLAASGLVTGSIYALVALGLAVIHEATGVINFAQGEFVLLGAFLTASFMAVLGGRYWLALAVSCLVAGLIGIAIERLGQRALRRRQADPLTLVLATLAISITLAGAARMVWGTGARSLSLAWPSETVTVGSVILTQGHIVILGLSLVTMVALYVVMIKTSWGRAMRATAESRENASLVGINVDRIDATAWALGAVLGALAGALMAPLTLLTLNIGSVLIAAFAASIIGGFGSMPGAVIGGVILGEIESFGAFLAPQEFAGALPFIIIGVIILIAPSGVIGAQVHERV